MRKKGTLLLIIGLLLIVGALGLTGYNLATDARAGKADDAILENIRTLVPEPVPIKDADSYVMDSVEIPDFLVDPLRDMPTVKIDGNEYIGVVRADSIGLELPVISECSTANLRIAPCRFTGSVYQDNMVIAGHNYSSHFGSIPDLKMGDIVTFADVEGNLFTYEVTEIEIVGPTQVEYMTVGEWDLTLFTCTWGGANRVTIRCDRIMETNE